jgi:predicted permease
MLLIFQEILPLLLIILIGVGVRRIAHIHPVVLASILIFVATPTVVFLGAYNLQLSIGLVLLPFCVCGIAITFALLCERYTRSWWSDGTHRLLAVSVGTSNTGYFGLPMAVAILGPDALPIAVMFGFGQILFENTFGYYLAARHQHSIAEARKKLLKLPSVYALLIGLALNYFHVELYDVAEKTLTLLRGLYTPLGMMIIGVTLAGLTTFKLDGKYLTAILVNKFLMWPLAVIGLIALDQHFFNLLPNEVYAVMLLQSIAPAAANTAAFAAQFDMHPDKAAVGILISTLIAVFYVPLVGSYLIGFL